MKTALLVLLFLAVAMVAVEARLDIYKIKFSDKRLKKCIRLSRTGYKKRYHEDNCF